MTQKRIYLGRHGEELASKCYQKNGWEVLERNWRCRDGELDIIAQNSTDKTLAFCEVKTRSNLDFGSPAEAITFRKQKQIRKLASIWLSNQKTYFSEIRFDVAEVMNDEVFIYSY